MNKFELIGYPLLFISAVEFLLTFILLREKQTTPLHKITAAFSFLAAFYCLFAGIVYVRASLGLDFDIFYRACWVGWIGIAPAFQLLFYIKEDKSRTARRVVICLYAFWIIIYILCLFTDLVEIGVYSLLPYVDRRGPLEIPVRLIGVVLIFWFIYELDRLRRDSKGLKRTQVNYLLVGVLIYGAGIALATGFIQLFGGFGFDPSLGSYFSLPWVALTFYAITRYRLFDISLIISRALMIVFLSLLLAALHIGLFRLFEPVMGATLAILTSLFLIGTVFFGTHLSRKVQWRILQFIEKHKYDYQGILKESIKGIITILDLDELLNYIIASIKKGLKVENICLSLRDKGGNFSLQYGDGVNQESESKCFLNNTAIDWLRRKGHVVARTELETVSYDNISLIMNEYMKKIGAELIIPLIYKGDIKGFITLGQKSSGEPYVRSEIDLLILLAAHAAIAIENARLYEEAKRSKASLLESESKFRTLADTASIAIFIHQGGKFLYANHAAEIIGGYTVDEYLTMDFLQLAHPDYLDTVKARSREPRSGHSPIQYEFKIVRKDGKERWVLMTAGITEYDGRSAIVGTLVDITARKQAEEETERLFMELEKATRSLKESEAKFRTLAETTTAGIFIHRGEKFLYANTAGEHITGYNQDELLAMDFWNIIHPDDREIARERGQARLAGAKLPKEYEFKIITKNGEQRWFNLTAGLIEYQGSPAIIATIFDINARKRAEDEKDKFYEESVKQYQKRIEEEKRYRIEKEKILMDLHDGIGGITTNISILAELAQKTSSLPEIKKTISVISRLSREGISEIRGFMHSLDNTDLNWRTLSVELRNQGTNMVEPHAITFALETSIDETHEQPGSLLWVNLFKIYKEALTNVIKHSRARNVIAKLQIYQEKLLLLIEDDGVGLGEVRHGRGLSNMRTRAEELGGSVTILSNSGTQVRVELPLPVKYHDQGIALKEIL
ncbi:MAG TPA: PAS domain S-box protein [Nitrospirota bacterium]|nr:PAS domain S-box protein [Nitrospirota bacterium]